MKTQNKLLTIGIVVLATCTAIPSPSNAAGLLVAKGGFGGQLEIKEHDVNVTINNGIAVTEVSEVFVNKENRVVEALYTFPVPNGASVSNFSMIINGKEVIGEVVEKKRARQIYESYKQTRKDPGLLEQVDYKRFEMRIFPIAAKAEQHVRLTYYQELDFDHDWGTYVYPLATNTEAGLSSTSSGRFSLTMDVKSEIPIAKFKSPSHTDEFVVAEHGETYRRASLETNDGDLNRDVVLSYQVKRPHTGVDVITSKQASDDGYFQLTMTAGEELDELRSGMDYVFLLDVSGSMAHDGKLQVSRSSLGAFASGLSEDDRFELIAFNVAPITLFNSLAAVNPENEEKAADFLTSQKARGGTHLRNAMETAYRYRDADRTLNVVVVSDGMTEQSEQQTLLNLIQQRPSGTRVFCVGVGNEVNRPLLSQIATNAGGLAAFLSQGDDMQRQAEAFRRKLMRPAASDLKITFDSDTVFDLDTAELPDLFHGSPIRVYGRYRRSGPVNITISGDALGTPFEQTVSVELPKRDDRNPEIERMWAYHQVQNLQDEARRTGSDSSVKDQIVRLCEDYSIVSEYASFIVLENNAEFKRWKIERKNANRVQRDRAARQAVADQLEQLRANSLTKLGPQSTDPQANQQVASNDIKNTISQTPSTQSPTMSTPRNPTTTPTRPSNSRNIRLPSFGDGRSGGGGGGGAIDPFTGLVALSVAGASAAGLFRRRKEKLRKS